MRGSIFFFAFLLIVFPCQAGTITVDDNGPADFNNIQAAINTANEGDIVIVSPGRYTGPGNRDIDFPGKAITVRSTDPNDPNMVAATIIDCNGTNVDRHRGFIFNSNEDSRTVLSGFTVTNAYASKGGGVYCRNSGPTITNCVFIKNSAREMGGGMWNYSGSPIIENCVFSGNSAPAGGGGMCNEYSSPTVANCTFTANWAYLAGGAMDNFASTTTIKNCTFAWNSTEAFAGGIVGISGSLTLTNCTFKKNSAPMGGAITEGTEQLVLTGCTFSGNAANEGGGILSYGGGPRVIINCTFAGNSGHGQAIACGLSNFRIDNCILWDGSDEIWNFDHSVITITYSNVQGGWPGEGNIDADPCFVDPGYWDATGVWVEGDYHLLPGSPCIDAGDNNSVPADTTDLDGDGNTAEPIPWDLDGNPRIVDGNSDGNSVVDMGAYEANYVRVQMKFTPQAVNPSSQGNWFKLHFVLPEGFAVEDVDVDKPAECRLMDTDGVAESVDMNVFVNEDDLVEVVAAFDRGAFSLCSSGQAERNAGVLGLLAGTGGQYFYGTDSIKIINKTWEHLAGLASHWLQTDCGKPDWCSGFDLNRDSVVNFLDFALFDACCIEIIAE